MPELEAEQQIVEQPEGEQPESSSEQGAEKQESDKPKGGWQRRIDKLTKRNHDLNDKLDRVLSAHDELLQRLAGNALPKQEKQADEDTEPQLDQFQTYEDYTKALGRWAARQETKELRAKLREEQSQNAAQTEQHQLLNEHAKRIEQARQELADYDDAIEQLEESGGDIENEAVLRAIVEQDNSAHLMYHLAKNPELIDKLNGMSATRAIAEVGKIAAKLEPPAKEEATEEAEEEPRSPEPKPIKQGKPEPIKPIRKASPPNAITRITGHSADEDKLTTEQWLELRNKQLRG